MPMLLRRFALAGLVAAIVVVVPVSRQVMADSRPSPVPFRSLIDRSILVVVITVTDVGPTETTLAVDRVLKGNAGSKLVLPTRVTNVTLTRSEQAVVAFETLDLDPRSGTIVWEVGPDGRLDPKHFQQAPGLPATLGALLAAFGLDQSSPTEIAAASSAADGQGSSSDNVIWISVVAGLLGLASVVVVSRRVQLIRSGRSKRE